MSNQDGRTIEQASRVGYWKANIRLTLILLAIWFFVAYVLGILLAPTLNGLGRIGGAPLGFWIAHQGAIYVFIALIIVYAVRMRRLDQQFGVED
ncbi:DUF4212 domain-containing protein [Deinococcus peraridilitoris]|uniref:Putative solute:sodium symporter small subunit n=1 Tax=Deinococcus peraridilitoris (strain DSM 19664 / LMG 22246 / CIP 109416 / KR-200) TaxID=937777 RepID=L0A7L2_DEIPD|nr:DUF4212 domain-containing protein [Deinococcus peraridilitoris]AFZ69045.1 putative solute:sodium symporter small subunit [Deinococcus peraridilitoris DSM 19664]